MREEWAWRCLVGSASLALAALSTFVAWKPRPPRVIGGTEIQQVLKGVPMLWAPQSWLQPPSIVQIFLAALLNVVWWRLCPYTFRREAIPVKLEGESVVDDSGDVVALNWLEQRELPADAPIVLLVLGLANTRVSLPGHSLYAWLLQRPWRIVVFEKRGVGKSHGHLQAPIFHLFGHPSDLHAAVSRIHEHFPEAPIHLVSFSAGNGVAGTYMRCYPEDRAYMRSCIMLMGGDDYNSACKLRNEQWLDGIVEKRLVQYVKNYFVRANEECLRRHSPEGYEAAVSAGTLQDFYMASMRHFSGYSDFDEADKKINGFRGGNEWLLRAGLPPTLAVATLDDPIAPRFRPDWQGVFCKGTHLAQATFDHGNHLACFQGWRFSRWLDELIFQWIDAVEKSKSS